jgi:DNA-binding protein H-NS
MDLANMSLGELKKLQSSIEKEINGRQKQQRNKALEEIKTVAAKYGLKLTDVVGNPAPPRKTRKAADKSAVKAAGKSAPKARVILFRHPDNPALTWSGGRGRRPQWVKDWEASGRKIEEARI